MQQEENITKNDLKRLQAFKDSLIADRHYALSIWKRSRDEAFSGIINREQLYQAINQLNKIDRNILKARQRDLLNE